MLLKRLRLGLSHLNEYRLIIILTVVSILYVLAALKWNQKKYFFLLCHHLSSIRDESILYVNDDDVIGILLFGNCKFSLEKNSSIIKFSINYIKNS